MTELIGVISTILGIAGVVLNNRRLRLCFLIWMASNALSLTIHAQAGIWSLVTRDGIFLILSLEGWFKWGKKDSREEAQKAQKNIYAQGS